MTPEEKLNYLTDYFRDIADYFESISDEFKRAAELIELSEYEEDLLHPSAGEEKQRRVRESRREDAIDELLKREGFSW